MLLRESGKQDGVINVAAVTDSALEAGLANGSHLSRLVRACISGDRGALADACATAESAMGALGVRDALIVAAGFNGITRVADATGIPLDPSTAEATRGLRASVIDGFDYAAKSRRYDPA